MNLLFALVLAVTTAPLDTATFAGGCFWSMERAFDQVAGVVAVTVGYTGGTMPHPSYEQVSTGQTGHLESVQVVYDPRRIAYERLVDTFWHDIDPTQADGQFCDHGDEYHGDFLSRLRTAPRGRGVTARAGGALRANDRYQDRAGDGILPCGRVSPTLLPQEPDQVRDVSRGMRPRPAPGGGVGRCGAARGGTFDHARHEAERRRAAAVADPVAVSGDPARGDGAGVPQRVLGQPPGRHLCGRGVGGAAVQLARQVRVGHGVAELHPAARGCQHPPEDRPVT